MDSRQIWNTGYINSSVSWRVILVISFSDFSTNYTESIDIFLSFFTIFFEILPTWFGCRYASKSNQIISVISSDWTDIRLKFSGFNYCCIRYVTSLWIVIHFAHMLIPLTWEFSGVVHCNEPFVFSGTSSRRGWEKSAFYVRVTSSVKFSMATRILGPCGHIDPSPVGMGLLFHFS